MLFGILSWFGRYCCHTEDISKMISGTAMDAGSLLALNALHSMVTVISTMMACINHMACVMLLHSMPSMWHLSFQPPFLGFSFNFFSFPYYLSYFFSCSVAGHEDHPNLPLPNTKSPRTHPLYKSKSITNVGWFS